MALAIPLAITPGVLAAAAALILFALGMIMWLTRFASREPREFDLWLKVPFLQFRLRTSAPRVHGADSLPEFSDQPKQAPRGKED